MKTAIFTAILFTVISAGASAFADIPVPVKKPDNTPYEKLYVGEMINYKAVYEDTLVQLARDHDLGFVEVRAANPYIDPWLPGAGKEIILPIMNLLPDAPRDGVVINLPEMRLYAFVKPGQPPVTHPIGIGRVGLNTPVGTTYIAAKKENPDWRPTKRMRDEDPKLPAIVRAGPENPLGTNILYLGWPEYAIHGTNKPFGIGRRVSSGCIRLYPEDIKTLYDKIKQGTSVTIVDQPVKAAWIDDKLYLEVHLTIDQADAMERKGGLPDYRISDAEMQVIIKKAGDSFKDLNWSVIRKVIRARNGYPIVIAHRSSASENIDDADTPEHSI